MIYIIMTNASTVLGHDFVPDHIDSPTSSLVLIGVSKELEE